MKQIKQKSLTSKCSIRFFKSSWLDSESNFAFRLGVLFEVESFRWLLDFCGFCFADFPRLDITGLRDRPVVGLATANLLEVC